jgi:APA family basic amino acid/polyamine antiporter
VLAATGTFEQLLTYVVFAGWGFYALGGLAIFHYRWRRPELPRPFRAPGYPVTPLLFVLAALGIVLSTFLAHPGRAALGTSMVAAGAPAYWLWTRLGARRDRTASS